MRTVHSSIVVVIAGLTALLYAACAEKHERPTPHTGTPTETSTPGKFTITSGAFEPGGAIPSRFTCSGANVSPMLRWRNPPTGTRALALIVDDPDAPAGTWTHWVLYDIPPATDSLAEGLTRAKAAALGIRSGRTSFGTPEYGGPCPPSGTHRYHFKLFALDTISLPADGVPRDTLEQHMAHHILGACELVGTYAR